MATKAKPAARKAAPAAKARPAARKPAANPFKKATAGFSAAQPQAEKKASTADAFGKGAQFTQATDWMRSSAEQLQGMFKQPFASQMPDFSQFSKAMPDFSQFTKSMPNFGGDASQFAQRSTDAATRSVQEMMALSTEQMQAFSECGSAVANMAKEMGAEVVTAANAIFSEQVELSKAMMACRNIDDVIELQSKASRNTIDTVLTESARLTELAFKHANEVAEPIQETMTSISGRFTKLIAA